MRTSRPRRRSTGSVSADKPTTLGRGCACATLTRPSESWAGCVRSTCRATRRRPSWSSCSRPCRSYWAWRSRCEVRQPARRGLSRGPHAAEGESLIQFSLWAAVSPTLWLSACITLRRKGEPVRKHIPAFLPSLSSFFPPSCCSHFLLSIHLLSFFCLFWPIFTLLTREISNLEFLIGGRVLLLKSVIWTRRPLAWRGERRRRCQAWTPRCSWVEVTLAWEETDTCNSQVGCYTEYVWFVSLLMSMGKNIQYIFFYLFFLISLSSSFCWLYSTLLHPLTPEHVALLCHRHASQCVFVDFWKAHRHTSSLTRLMATFLTRNGIIITSALPPPQTKLLVLIFTGR